jgi:hypothetical protein
MILVLTSSLSCPNYLNTNFESVYPITVVLRQLLQGLQAALRGSSLAPALPLKPAMPRLRSQSLLLLHGSGNKVSTRKTNEDPCCTLRRAAAGFFAYLRSLINRSGRRRPNGEAHAVFSASTILRDSTASYRTPTTGRQPVTTRYRTTSPEYDAATSCYQFIAIGCGSVTAGYGAATAGCLHVAACRQ